MRIIKQWFITLAMLLLACSAGTRHPELPPETEAVSELRERGSRYDDADEEAGVHYKHSSRKPANESGLRAGYADDNKQYNYFLNFLNQYAQKAEHYSADINERIHFSLQDQVGKSLPNAKIEVYNGSKLITSGKTFADGSFFFFPSLYNYDTKSYTIKYNYANTRGEFDFNRNDQRNQIIPLQLNRKQFNEAAIDILFILDTTGSMGEEINRLKSTLEIIHYNLVSINSSVNVRFGLVLYRDQSDDYVTNIVPLTSDVDKFLGKLNKVEASGGGDGPEDLQAALEAAVKEINWNPEALHLGFVITDAPPHLDYGQEYTYIDAAFDAKKAGIKLFGVGTGGLDINGEYVLRQISQLTYARYIFLTYGERGESDGGHVGSVSHHTGDNYQTDKLESIILQFAREELSHIIDIPLERSDEYFEAIKINDETSEQTLAALFSRALSQLEDYSSIKLDTNTTMAVMPIAGQDTLMNPESKYFTEQLILSAGSNKSFKLADRSELDKLFAEWKLHLAGAISDSLTIEVGELTGAQLMLIGNMFKKSEQYELFLKLVRVETGELLSATKLKIDHRLMTG